MSEAKYLKINKLHTDRNKNKIETTTSNEGIAQKPNDYSLDLLVATVRTERRHRK
jgi:hypothetical protein